MTTRSKVWIFAFSLIGFSLYSPVSLAQWEHTAFVNFRSYPLSASANWRTGYPVLLWGENNSESILYGYLKPNATFSTAGLYNSLTAQVDVFPISFFGFKAGGEIEQNDYTYHDIECTQVACNGQFQKTWWSGHLALGYGHFFSTLSYRQEYLHYESSFSGFMDPSARLATLGSRDTLTYTNIIAGFTSTDKVWSTFGLHSHAQMKNAQTQSTIQTLNIQYQAAPYKLMLGMGTYASDFKKQGFTILSRLTYDFTPSLGFF